MLDLETETAHLAKAEQDISEGERRIAGQVDLIARLQNDGHDTASAEDLLANLEQTLATWRDHRDEILRTIARLKSGEI